MAHEKRRHRSELSTGLNRSIPVKDLIGQLYFLAAFGAARHCWEYLQCCTTVALARLLQIYGRIMKRARMSGMLRLKEVDPRRM